MTRSFYFCEKDIYPLRISKGTASQNYEHMGKETKAKRPTTSCYKYGDRYFLGHRCQNKTMMAMEEVFNQGELATEEEIVEEENLTTNLSIQVIEGISAGNTLKLRGTLSGRDVLVLLDSGSSHSFLDEEVAKGIKIQVVSDKPLTLMVVNG